MKAKNFNEMNTAELSKKLSELKAELFNLRFKNAAHDLPNNSALKNCRRDIARVNTILRRREILEKNAK